jgi:hypothetical protein
MNLMDSYKKELDKKLFPHIEKLIEENQLAFALQHMSKSYYIHSKEVVVNNMKKGYFEGKRVSMTNLNNADYLAIYTNDKRLASYFTTKEIMNFASKRTIAEYIFIYLIDYPLYSLREEYFKKDIDNVKREIKELTDSLKVINENFIKESIK